jgi:pyruvate carboxylase subunit B
VTPFSQYVKNVALMNVMSLIKGEERWTMIDNHTWDMILGKSGRLPGALAPEIIALAKEKGYEFTDEDPQKNYPDQLDEYRKEMTENSWDLQRAKDAALAKQGFSEEEVKRMKRAKAEPVTAMEKGQIIWEIDVESPSMPPEVGHKYDPDDVFCYIATPWHTYDKVLANFSGRVIEVCAKQGALVDKGEPLAYIERCEEPA